ncbi:MULTISPECIES: cation:proton antiporter [unclassified Hahella]|uniref:cation:proton antiporter n=1 Tax=unclassified Hahella TaxID=2624107 RepID=UPI001C1EE298|nr:MULTISPECIES: sodium:proton antiporter [unclassified Hahella]MBU6949966.1 cation:proton antiporter [Hahella sp. HN01]MDG9668241.1 cation:proton antiporter [Hahella sp. CR1]
MNEHVVVALAAILFFGVASQYIAWKLKLPSILLLLLSGIVLGPTTGVLNPDEIFGDFLFPAISFAVAIILFEGGLSLKLAELKTSSTAVRSLVSVGILITWFLAFFLSWLTLDVPWILALLIGAILTVTGPTVVLPLLMLIRPKGQVNSILKWEGILNDPIGALLTVLVYEAVVSTSVGKATTLFLSGFLLTVVVGGLMGLIAGMLVATALRHHWIPEFLGNTFTLAMVMCLFTASNLIQHESGLFSVTIMGIYLGNQRLVSIRNLVGFKEDLRVLLLSSMFIVLAARLDVKDLEHIHAGSFAFLLLLVFLVRPAAVWASTVKSNLSWKEKVFLSSMAPRGIVAAAVASLFAVRLQGIGYEEAEALPPTMFLIIMGTILIYGLGARPLAKKLALSDDNPQGCIILGSNAFTNALAKALKNENVSVLIVDARWSNIKEARMEGTPTLLGNVLSEQLLERVNYTGMGRFLALTPNLELNSLACIRFSDIFGVKEVYQLGEPEDKDKPAQWIPEDLSGVALFSTQATYNHIMRRLNHGAVIKRTPLTKDFTYEQFKEKNQDQDPLPLCLVGENGTLNFFTVKKNLQPKPGQVLISLVG